MLPQEVRRIVPPGFVIGCSVHTIATASARKAADFLVAGTVLPTRSKSSTTYLGADGLRQIVKATTQPVFGIGGLDHTSMPLLVSAGGAGLAAVGAFIPSTREDVSGFLQKRVIALRFGLETSL
jgi:thiamine monophosphate synthase